MSGTSCTLARFSFAYFLAYTNLCILQSRAHNFRTRNFPSFLEILRWKITCIDLCFYHKLISIQGNGEL